MIIHRWKERYTATSARFLSKKEGSPARTFRKVFPFIDVGRWWWWVSNTKTSWKLERVRIEARNIRPSLKRRLEQRGGVSRLKHSPARFPHS